MWIISISWWQIIYSTVSSKKPWRERGGVGLETESDIGDTQKYTLALGRLENIPLHKLSEWRLVCCCRRFITNLKALFQHSFLWIWDFKTVFLLYPQFATLVTCWRSRCTWWAGPAHRLSLFGGCCCSCSQRWRELSWTSCKLIWLWRLWRWWRCRGEGLKSGKCALAALWRVICILCKPKQRRLLQVCRRL